MFRGMSVCDLSLPRGLLFEGGVSPDVRSPSHSPVFPPPPTQNCFYQPSPHFSNSYYKISSAPQSLMSSKLSNSISASILNSILQNDSHILSLPSHAVILQIQAFDPNVFKSLGLACPFMHMRINTHKKTHTHLVMSVNSCCQKPMCLDYICTKHTHTHIYLHRFISLKAKYGRFWHCNEEIIRM